MMSVSDQYMQIQISLQSTDCQVLALHRYVIYAYMVKKIIAKDKYRDRIVFTALWVSLYLFRWDFWWVGLLDGKDTACNCYPSISLKFPMVIGWNLLLHIHFWYVTYRSWFDDNGLWHTGPGLTVIIVANMLVASVDYICKRDQTCGHKANFTRTMNCS